MCTMLMFKRYRKTENVPITEAGIDFWFRIPKGAAPKPVHAEILSWVAVTVCFTRKLRRIARLCVRSTRTEE